MSLKSVIRYGLTSLILSSALGLGFIWKQLSAMEQQYVAAENMRTLERGIQRLYADAAQMVLSVRTLIIDPSNTRAPGNIKSSIANIENSFKDLDEVAKATSHYEKFRPVFADLETQIRSDIEQHKKSLALIADHRASEAAALMKEVQNPIWRKYRDSIVKTREEIGNLANETSQLAREQSERQKKVIIALSLLLVGMVIGIYAFATRLLKTITSDIEGLRTSANVAAESSESLSQASEDLSRDANQQASALQQTSVALTQITQMIARNSESAVSLEGKANSSEDAARSSHAAVEKMVSVIGEINAKNKELVAEIQNSNHDIEDVIQIINDIGSKTKVINEIVFQTKLLSFNASVEAARAGEAGKGFAVVAEEVGNLAEMSGQAAQDISTLLDQSTKQVQGIVDATRGKLDSMVQSANSKVEEGIRVVQNCGDTLTVVVQSVQESGQMVKSISNASSEQSTGIQEINKAVHELERYAHQNATTSQNTLSSAHKMKEQAEVLDSALNALIKTVNG